MSSRFPSSFTLPIKAGGKLYSRPQRSPIFIVSLPFFGTDVFSSGKESRFGELRSFGIIILFQPIRGAQRESLRGRSLLRHSRARIRDDMLHHFLQITSFLEHAQLTFGARTFAQNSVNWLQRRAASEFARYVVGEFQELFA